jgi:hypothetical protein
MFSRLSEGRFSEVSGVFKCPCNKVYLTARKGEE